MCRFDAREKYLRDPHRHRKPQEITFWWLFTVILVNSFTMYCLLNNTKISIDEFLTLLRDDLIPKHKLIPQFEASKNKHRKLVVAKHHCFVCKSTVYGNNNHVKSKTNLYCKACRKWLHQDCGLVRHNIINSL
jgi:hypothetical protein